VATGFPRVCEPPLFGRGFFETVRFRREAGAARVTIGDGIWETSILLKTWERPLQLLIIAHMLLAIGFLVRHWL